MHARSAARLGGHQRCHLQYPGKAKPCREGDDGDSVRWRMAQQHTAAQVSRCPADNHCERSPATRHAHRPQTEPARPLLPWSNPEFVQAVARIFIVGCAMVFTFSDFGTRHSPSARNVLIGQWVAVAAGLATALIMAWTLRSPAPSVSRRLIGITHDTLAISIAMYLGVDANATFAWCTWS